MFSEVYDCIAEFEYTYMKFEKNHYYLKPGHFQAFPLTKYQYSIVAFSISVSALAQYTIVLLDMMNIVRIFKAQNR